MKQVKLFLSLLFVFLFITCLSVRADSATAPASLNLSTCGFANIEGADQCCENNTVSEETIKNDAKGKVDSATGAIIDLIPKADLIGSLGLNNVLNKKCYLGEPTTGAGGCICKTTVEPTVIANLAVLCNRYYTGKNKASEIQQELDKCISCVRGGGLLTGIGCIPINLGNFVSNFVLATGIGLGGLFSLLCIIYSALMMQTSQGNPEKIKKAQENLTSCIIGLILIIFSVFILRLIGIQIIKIPGFS